MYRAFLVINFCAYIIISVNFNNVIKNNFLKVWIKIRSCKNKANL